MSTINPNAISDDVMAASGVAQNKQVIDDNFAAVKSQFQAAKTDIETLEDDLVATNTELDTVGATATAAQTLATEIDTEVTAARDGETDLITKIRKILPFVSALPDPFLEVSHPYLVQTWNPGNISPVTGGPHAKGGWTVSNNAGRIYQLSETDIAVGQQVTFAFQFEAAAASNWRLQVVWQDSAGATIGATETGATVNGDGAPKIAALTSTRPSGAVTLQIIFSRASGSGTCIVWAAWGEVGTTAARIPTDDASVEFVEILKLKTPNLLSDPYFQGISKVGDTNNEIAGWLNTSVITLVDNADAFKTRRLEIQNASAAVSGRLDFNLAAMSLAVGDFVTFSAMIATAGAASGRLQLEFYDSGGAAIGSIISGNALAASGTQGLVSVFGLIPSGAVTARVYLARTSGAGALQFYTLWANKGFFGIDKPILKRWDTTAERLVAIEANVRLTELKGKYPVPLVQLVGNTNDPVPTVTLGSYSGDKEFSLKKSSPGARLNISGVGTGTIRWDFGTALDFGYGQAAILAIYIDDVSKISAVALEIYSDVSPVVNWVRSSQVPRCQIINVNGVNTQPATVQNLLRTGWNFLRWNATAGVTTGWGIVERVRVTATATAATFVTVGGVWIEKPTKGNIVFIQDGGYKNFRENGYPAMLSRNMPCTWAINPQKADDGSDAGTMSLAEMRDGYSSYASIHNDGNSYFGEHSYNREDLDPFTVVQMRSDHVKSARWFDKNGFGKIVFRPAHTQNSAPNAIAAQKNLMDLRALATSLGNTGGMETNPLIDRWNIVRFALHAYNGNVSGLNSYLSDFVTKFRGTMYIYTHKIQPDGTNSVDSDQSVWNAYLAFCDANAANLEYHSYETLQQQLFNSGLQDSDESIFTSLVETLSL
jgi:hypothetical protein